MRSRLEKAKELRESAYKILLNNKNIPWIEMWEIDRAADYLKEAKELENNINDRK